MGNSSPLVSIGMPVLNGQETVGLALRSLLAQTFQKWELLLIDDGSTDNTPTVLCQFPDPRIKVFLNDENRGLPARLNQAITMSGGRYFARMDQDDIAYPKRLERQVSFLEKHPDVDLVGAWVVVFVGEGIPIGKRNGPETHADISAKPWAGFPIVHPTFLGRLEWFRRFGYRECAQWAEDQDLLSRAYRSSKFSNLPEILLGYREEKLNLKKCLRGRRSFARASAREFCRHRRYGLALGAVVGQVFKGAVDCVAIGTGLNYQILRHRARPIMDLERHEWTRVWTLVNHEVLE